MYLERVALPVGTTEIEDELKTEGECSCTDCVMYYVSRLNTPLVVCSNCGLMDIGEGHPAHRPGCASTGNHVS